MSESNDAVRFLKCSCATQPAQSTVRHASCESTSTSLHDGLHESVACHCLSQTTHATRLQSSTVTKLSIQENPKTYSPTYSIFDKQQSDVVHKCRRRRDKRCVQDDFASRERPFASAAQSRRHSTSTALLIVVVARHASLRPSTTSHSSRSAARWFWRATT